MVALPGVQDDHAPITAERAGEDDPSIGRGRDERARIGRQRQPLRIMAGAVRFAELAQNVAGHGKVQFRLQFGEFICRSNAVFVGHAVAGERPRPLPFGLALAPPFLFFCPGEGGGVAHRTDVALQAAYQPFQAGRAGGKLLGAAALGGERAVVGLRQRLVLRDQQFGALLLLDA